MRLENYYPFLLIIAPFAIAYLIEAIVIYFFRLKHFWAAIGLAVLINFLSLIILYGSSLLVGKLGYQISGLLLPVQVVLLFWWLSVITDGFLLQLFTKRAESNRIFVCSIVMNTLSWIFLYFFILNSQ
jgi:hypothetical protein